LALKNAKKKKKSKKKNYEIKQQLHIIELSNHRSSYQLSIALPTELQFDVCCLKIAITRRVTGQSVVCRMVYMGGLHGHPQFS
jgi:hypothetical protein